ncbi:lysophospholipid acyltransferase family protein [Streptomonospora litoralis]|uniref:2-acyl-glycerophospho-ethanolamine acyltransferase n=1 Tax=Streptomonospora litoralis TaxID=2498135 RepID=A0A4P6Q535_9ACTN|nr:lysophospholipid acyltransferase family protein [Streptomonospora litoralis]QBI54461.1 2-acyl-glycerophospho-ethanolamine acyltransferase [Streptomonospora litoralis]
MLYDVVRSVSARVGRGLYRPRIEGLANIPASGPVILAANHLSFCDSVVIPLAVPRRVHFLAKAEYFTGPGVKGRLSRSAFTALGAVPVDRGSGGGAMEALDIGLRRLKDGGVFSIYPEGTRSPDGRLYRGRTGVAHLALTSQAPVVPVGITGTEHIQPIGARLPRIAPITVRFGDPLDFSIGYGHLKTGRARRVATDEVMAAIGRLTGQEEAGVYNDRAAGY